MYKIDKLDIKSFKFFKNVLPLEFNKKNILIYGENGSGKSSIYWALYTFFQSSIKELDDDIKKYFTLEQGIENEDSLVNIFEDDDTKSKIEIAFKDTTNLLPDKIFTVSKNLINTNKDDLLIEKGCYTGDFISYKYLFRFFDFLHKDDIDLFMLFEYEIFHSIIRDGKSLSKWWEEILNLYDNKPGPRTDRTDYADLRARIVKFNGYLSSLLPRVQPLANDYLEKFSYSEIEVSLNIDEGSYTSNKKFTKPKINLSISLKKNESETIPIKKPQSFFNEAKLTAIALSIRFAITSVKHTDSSLNILVLDDLLVSLDMSNREKVLSILLEDEIISTFQIIILTHDKAFYEKSREIFRFRARTKWKFFEMYLDIDETEDIEQPYIKEYGDEYGNIAVAKEHLIRKDYPACANYLRKEVELQFDKYLKLDDLDAKILLSKIKSNHDFIKKIGNNLRLIVNALKRFENIERIPADDRIEKCVEFSNNVVQSLTKVSEEIDNGFYFVEFEDVRFILKNILHPQSHNDLSRPLYKIELENALSIVEEFNELLNENGEDVE